MTEKAAVTERAGAAGRTGMGNAAGGAGRTGIGNAVDTPGETGAGNAAGAEKEILQPLARPVKGAGGPTGTWRSQRPVVDKAKCTGCLLCWIYCPEAVIAREDRAVDYEYCKGCGICAGECPAGAIKMVREGGDEA